MRCAITKTLPAAALMAAILALLLPACASSDKKPSRKSPREKSYTSKVNFKRDLEIETPVFEEGYEGEKTAAKEPEDLPPADPEPVVKKEDEKPPPRKEETPEETVVVKPPTKEEVRETAAANKKNALETMGEGEGGISPWGSEDIADMENLRARKAGQALSDLDLMSTFPVEDEIELGRGAAARVLHGTPELKNERLWRYVTFVGLSLHEYIRPDQGNLYTFYFIVLDSPEPNAFAVPGGFVFINKGAIDACRNEAELASILAHEISHVTLRHGVRSLDKSKYRLLQKSAVSEMHESIERDWKKNPDDPKWNKAMEEELDAIGDEFYSRTLAPFNRDLEREADRQGLLFLARAGYNPYAAVTVMERMAKARPGKKDVKRAFSSHPHPEERMDTMRTVIRREKLSRTGRLNERRFRAYTGQ